MTHSLAQPKHNDHTDDHHALLARRAVRQQLEAVRSGDDALARLYGRIAAEHVNRHLAAMRACERRLP